MIIFLKTFYNKHRLWLLLLAVMLLIFVIFLIPLLIFAPLKELFSHPESIKTYILSFQEWAIVVYVAISILVVVSPPLPNEVVSVIGGIVFGFWTALIFGLIARIIGSSINYFLGSRIRKGFYLKLISDEEKERLNHYTKKIGWQAVFISRFASSTDTDLIAYVAGMSEMDYGKFILASFFGMIAPLAITIFIGASLFKNKYLFFLLIASYVLGILFAPKIVKKLINHNKPSA